MALANGVQIFISRPNGAFVPLIAMDQLPTEVQLRGVPRELKPAQLMGMRSFGELPFSSSFEIEQPSNRYSAPDAQVRAFATQQSWRASSEPGTLPSSKHAPQISDISWRENTGTSQPSGSDLANKFAATLPKAAERLGYTPSRTPPSGRMPDGTRKEFCSYWIRTGECDFEQQGCMYKHEMPPMEKLRELGFRKVPDWWELKNAVKPLTGLRRKIEEAEKEERQHPANIVIRDSESESEDSVISTGGACKALWRPTALPTRPVQAVAAEVKTSLTPSPFPAAGFPLQRFEPKLVDRKPASTDQDLDGDLIDFFSDGSVGSDESNTFAKASNAERSLGQDIAERQAQAKTTKHHEEADHKPANNLSDGKTRPSGLELRPSRSVIGRRNLQFPSRHQSEAISVKAEAAGKEHAPTTNITGLLSSRYAKHEEKGEPSTSAPSRQPHAKDRAAASQRKGLVREKGAKRR